MPPRLSRFLHFALLASVVTLVITCGHEPDAPIARPLPTNGAAPPQRPSGAMPAPPTAAPARKLEPLDEASKDPSFLKFRQQLLEAVERRDARYVVSILDPKIHNSFGGDGGIEEFKAMWKPERRDSKLWDELRKVLTHGGAFEDGTFWAPYVYTNFPEDLDAFDYGAVLEDKVLLRLQPEASAPIVATLSYHIVKIDYEGSGDLENPTWCKVVTTDGLEGYVAASSVTSPVDYRAGFERKGDAWRMVTFIAGD